MRGKFRLIQAIAISLTLLFAAPRFLTRTAGAQSQVTTPEKFFGFRLGTDQKMARWDKIVEYYQEARAGSGRVVEFMWPSFSFKEMGEHLASLGLVRFGTIGAATIRGIRTKDMVDTILATIAAEPDQWLVESFRPWWHEAMG